MNTTLRALVNQAERLVRAEVYEEAIALCHAILRGYPRYVRGYRILAEAHLGLGNHGEAADLFRRTLGVDPEDPLGYAGLGIIFASRGLREEAIWQLERAFELAPGRDGLRGELARLYREQGMATQVQLTRAALARLYARGGLWNKAIGELRELVLREPYRLDLQASLVRTLWRAQRGDEAAEAARAVLGQAPNCLVARLVLGAYLCRQGHADEAQPLLQGAQELDPEGYEATRLLGAEWPRLLATAGLSATPAELAREAEDAEPPDTTSLAGATPAGETSLPSWLACDDEAGDAGAHIAMLPDGPIRALLGNLAEQEAAIEGEDDLPFGSEDGVAKGRAAEPAAGDGVAPAPRATATTPRLADPEAPPLSPLAQWQQQLDLEPDDHQARLGLARALVKAGRLDEALGHYDALASLAGCLADVIADLEGLAGVVDDHRALRELLGDAYARAGRFQDAMEMYRWLLEHGGT